MPARSGSGQPQIKNSPTRSKKERAGLLLILAGLVVLALPFYLVYNTLSGREQEAATEIETLAIALNATCHTRFANRKRFRLSWKLHKQIVMLSLQLPMS